MATETRSLTTKVSPEVAEKVASWAKSKNLTVSRAVRRFIERGLAEDVGTGPIEAATTAFIGSYADHAGPRGPAALDLARRLDVDPSNGATRSRELDRLLGLIETARRADVTHQDARRGRASSCCGPGTSCAGRASR